MNEQDVPNEKMILQLGDIIQIVAPSDPLLHEQIYLIDYIDKRKIENIGNILEKLQNIFRELTEKEGERLPL